MSSMSGRDLNEQLAATLLLEQCDLDDETDCLVTLIAAEDRPCSARVIALVLDEVRALARKMAGQTPTHAPSSKKH
ncbi:hypothetical protein [Alsobacter sp. R-9]